MNPQEIRQLVERINALDGRIPANPDVVQAWFDLLEASAPGISLTYAMSQVTSFYSKPEDRPIRPSDLIHAWRTARQAHGTIGTTPVLDAHCKRGGCQCAHKPPCYRGFHEDNPGQFCKTCNPIRQAAIDDMPPPGQRSQFDIDAFIAKAKL